MFKRDLGVNEPAVLVPDTLVVVGLAFKREPGASVRLALGLKGVIRS